MKRVYGLLCMCGLSLLAVFVGSGCRTQSVFDPYAVVFPDEEPMFMPVLPQAPPAAGQGEEDPAPRRRLFGRRSGADQAAAEMPSGVNGTDEPPVELVNPANLPDRYLLRIGDPLQIHITGSGLDEQLEMPVDENGEITLRFIGRVRAAGRSLAELEREIELEYTERQQIYRQIFVRVTVPYTFYFIGGEVRNPGRFPLVGRVTLSQAIVAAGNFTEWARRDGRLTLVRNNERTVILFREILDDPTRDIELRTGDVITVERSFL